MDLHVSVRIAEQLRKTQGKCRGFAGYVPCGKGEEQGFLAEVSDLIRSLCVHEQVCAASGMRSRMGRTSSGAFPWSAGTSIGISTPRAGWGRRMSVSRRSRPTLTWRTRRTSASAARRLSPLTRRRASCCRWVTQHVTQRVI